MSYGVVASKPAQVRVESFVGVGSGVDVAPVSSPWASGRLTLTSLHLTFVPTRTSPGVPALTIGLADVLSVQTGSGRASGTLQLRTADRVLHARVTGAAAFAKRVSTSVEANRRRAPGPTPAELVEQVPERSLTSDP